MPAKRLIPTAAEAGMVRLAVEGKTHDEIAEWVAREWRVRVTRRAVSMRLMLLRSERSEAAQAIVTEKLAVQVCKDIDVMSGLQRDLVHDVLTLRRAAGLGGEYTDGAGISPALVDVYLRAAARLESVTDRKLHYSGADVGEGEKPPESASSDFLAKLDRLIRREAEQAPTPLH